MKIDHPNDALNRAMVRLWAVLVYVTDKAPVVKLLCSSTYRYVRYLQVQIIQGKAAP